MDVKLTLKMDQGVIERAKQYARAHELSLSKLVEGYLDGLTESDHGDPGATPLVNSLTGIIKVSEGKSAFNSKYLKEKYK